MKDFNSNQFVNKELIKELSSMRKNFKQIIAVAKWDSLPVVNLWDTTEGQSRLWSLFFIYLLEKQLRLSNEYEKLLKLSLAENKRASII